MELTHPDQQQQKSRKSLHGHMTHEPINQLIDQLNCAPDRNARVSRMSPAAPGHQQHQPVVRVRVLVRERYLPTLLATRSGPESGQSRAVPGQSVRKLSDRRCSGLIRRGGVRCVCVCVCKCNSSSHCHTSSKPKLTAVIVSFIDHRFHCALRSPAPVAPAPEGPLRGRSPR